MSRRLIAVGAVGAAAAALSLWSALGPQDLTAGETARILERESPHRRDVLCVRGDHGWDYTCGFTVTAAGRELRSTIGVDVDSDSITAFTAP